MTETGTSLPTNRWRLTVLDMLFLITCLTLGLALERDGLQQYPRYAWGIDTNTAYAILYLTALLALPLNLCGPVLLLVQFTIEKRRHRPSFHEWLWLATGSIYWVFVGVVVLHALMPMAVLILFLACVPVLLLGAFLGIGALLVMTCHAPWRRWLGWTDYLAGLALACALVQLGFIANMMGHF